MLCILIAWYQNSLLITSGSNLEGSSQVKCLEERDICKIFPHRGRAGKCMLQKHISVIANGYVGLNWCRIKTVTSTFSRAVLL